MADVVVARVRVSANTSTGNQDITTTDLGGKTPKGVLFYYVGATGDGAFDDAHIGIGAASGASERWTLYGNSEHGVGSTDTRRGLLTDEVIRFNVPGSSSIDGEADIVSFITNGVRINWSNAPSGAYQIIAVFFAGDDVDAHADTHAVDPNLDITAPGFQPNLVFTATGNLSDDEETSDLNFGHGWQDGAATPTRSVQNISEEEGEASGDPTARTLSDRSILALNESSGGVDYEGHYDTFDASGMTYRGDDDSDDTAYLALRLQDAEIKVGRIDTPTSTGNFGVTGVGFVPDIVFLGMNMLTAIDSATTNGNAGSQGYSVFTDTDEDSLSIQIEDGSGTTDTQSSAEDRAVFLPEDDGTTGFNATYVSMDADGFTLNFTDVLGTARKWFYLAIKAGDEDGQGQVSWGEVEVPDSGRGQVSWTELETPDEAGQGQVSWTEFETPDEAGQGQVSWTEMEVPDPDAQGQISWTEMEVPDTGASANVSWAEAEIPSPDSTGQISWAELQIPTQQIEQRAQVAWTELETPDPAPDSRGTVGFAQFEVPDAVPADTRGQISQAEVQFPNVNAGGDSDVQMSWTEFEVPSRLAVQVARLFVTIPETRRRGRVSWARVEFASVPNPNRVIKTALKDINRDLFLNELEVYGIRPDVGFFMPGFDPIPEEVGYSSQRNWTPKTAASIQFGELAQPGEMWFDYSFQLTEEDLFHLQYVCFQHDSSQTTDEQDADDQFREDLDVLRGYNERCEFLTPAEQADCHCRLLRFVLQLTTETTVRRIQDEPLTEEELD